MFGSHRDNLPAIAACSPRGALDREVVGFGRPTGEDQIPKTPADERRDLLARPFDGFAGLPSEGMVAARRVTEVFGEERQHGLEHAWIDRSRRMRVHVDDR